MKHPMLLLRGNREIKVTISSVQKLVAGYIVQVIISTFSEAHISIESVAEAETLDQALSIATMRALVQYNELVCDEEKLRDLCLFDLLENPLNLETEPAMKQFISEVMPQDVADRFPDITLQELGAIELYLNMRKK